MSNDQDKDDRVALESPAAEADIPLAEKVAELEKSIDALKVNPKDGWDKAQILSAFLVPVAITVVGYLFSQSTKEAEISIAETNARVSQAQLVQSFTSSLTSDNPDQRKIAIEAVLLALPDDGTRLVETVKEFDPDASVREFARQRLGSTDLYAEITYYFSNYEDSDGIPPQPLFDEGAELTIYLKERTGDSNVEPQWLNGALIDEPDAILTTRRQTVDRKPDPTVDGMIMEQTNTLDRFQGSLGRFASPGAWANSLIEAIYRVQGYEKWLSERDIRPSPDEFDEFYSISKETRRNWSNSDYSVRPELHATLTVYLGSEPVAHLPGIVARVWEHDEDVRYLYVTRFARFVD